LIDVARDLQNSPLAGFGHLERQEMTMITGGATLTIVESRFGAMQCESYKDRLAAVLSIVDNGAFGGGVGYGCNEHKAALVRLEQQIAATRATIAENEAQESGPNAEVSR
jgi:hypothetical protein